MAGPLEAAGGAHEPSQYAPLSMDRYVTGLWTQRSPLRDAAVPYVYGKFYGASRYDSLIDGLNREITSKLTFKRRPGHSIFNEQAFPAIRSFYSFKFMQDGVQSVRVIADSVATGEIFDATPPVKSTIMTKSAGAGPARFLGVGNQLYMADGVDTMKWTLSLKSWKANTQYAAGDFIVDTNGNIEYVYPNSPATATISNLQIIASVGGGTTSYLLVITWTGAAPNWVENTPIKFAGLTGTVELNGLSLTYNKIDTQTLFGFTPTAQQTCFIYYRGPQAAASETGTGTGTSSDAGTSGSTQPTWPTTMGATTVDPAGGTLVWTNMGPSLNKWGIAGPTTAPTLVADPACRFWQPLKNLGQWYSILDSNGNLEVITGNSSGSGSAIVPSTTMSTASASQTSPGSTTNPGTPAGGFPSTPVTGNVTITADISGNWTYATGGAAGQFQISIDGGVTWQTPFYQQNSSGSYGTYGYSAPGTIAVVSGLTNLNTLQVRAVAVASAGMGSSGPGNSNSSAILNNLRATLSTSGGSTPGTVTGTGQPPWAEILGGASVDGSFTWTNCGNVSGTWTGSTPTLKFEAILDVNQNLQIATVAGTTGTTAPGSWATALGATTTDGGVTWTNAGPGVVLVSGDLSYAYSYHTVDGSITTPSPIATIPNGVLGPPNGFKVTLTGLTPADPQCDQIFIWRTDQGGNTLVFRAAIPNPTPGTAGTWTWTDTDPTSAALNPLISTPPHDVAANNPPPSTATAPEYHLQRIWMIDGSRLVWSAGPDAVSSNGNTAFPATNVMQFPETLTRLVSVVTKEPMLMIFGTANIYAVLGLGTPLSPFYPIRYMKNVGLLNYDALELVGSTFYAFTNTHKGAELDPGAGYVEFGFPIGDQFKVMSTGGQSAALYDPKKAYVTWHETESGDTGLYVCDGSVGWFRYSPIAPPESGFLWSPFAAIVGGTSAVQSVEVATGEFELLVGPAGEGPILKRDTSVFSDKGFTYGEGQCYGVIGSIVLCQSGEVAEIAHIELDSMRVGDRPQVGMLYNEIAETSDIDFDVLDYTSVDPPTLDESETLYSDRYVTSQDGVCPKCTHCQILINWPDQPDGDELLAHVIYGAKWGERREQPG